MSSPRAVDARRRSVLQRMRANLVSGLIVMIPIGLTLHLAWSAISWVDAKIGAVLPIEDDIASYLGFPLPGFGLLVFVAATAATGYLTKGRLGRQLVRIGERQVEQLPVVRSIYGGLKQLVVTVFEQSDRSFQQVCLIEYPHRGKWALALVSGKAKGELPERTGEDDLVSVFMPTTPNPITGFLLYLPRRDVVMLDMSFEDGAKLIVSAGLVAPPARGAAREAAGDSAP